ncbi:MAG: hypothetical protein HY867_13235 [Chloroflexi bacterium]|nr:hypothetical protein [Chloroflexota bacterium]
MKKVFVAKLLAIVLSSCSSIAPSPTATPTLTSIFKTPTPFPTITSFEAFKIFPADKFLFVEVGRGEMCSEECNCPVSEPIAPPYKFIDGKLYIWDVFLDFREEWAEARLAHKAIGFYSYQTMHEAHYAFITSLPYQSPDSDFIVNGVDIQGNISVTTLYGKVFLKPTEFVNIEWIETTDVPYCEISHLVGIQNYGFIEDDQVIILRFEEGDEYPYSP